MARKMYSDTEAKKDVTRDINPREPTISSYDIKRHEWRTI
jgi:hypothetical protein